MHPQAPLSLDPFYPIAPDLNWMQRLVPLGVKTIQLRLKDAHDDDIRAQIKASIELCRAHHCQLIVNDYWKTAIELGANAVHLGQEDFATADRNAIAAAGLRLGISTHDDAELATALAAKPDYIALGPIWETKLKAMKWAPQGLERIRLWKARIGDLPLVAIGGITPERAPSVIAAGAQSAAVITDFITAQDPEGRVREWLTWASSVRQKHASAN